MAAITLQRDLVVSENKSKKFLKIFSFDRKMQSWASGRFVPSNPFFIGETQLEMQVYPNGDSVEKQGFVSVFLQNQSAWDVKMNLKIKMGDYELSWNNCHIGGGSASGWSEAYPHYDLYNDNVLRSGSCLTVSSIVSLAWEEFATDVRSSLSQLKSSMSEVEILKLEVNSLKSTISSLENSLVSRLKRLEISSKKNDLPCPECPICFEDMKPPMRIVQCKSGHLICLQCGDRPEVLSCPTCKKEFTGRAIGMENYLRAIFC